MKILFLQPLVSTEALWGRFKKGMGFVPPLGIISIAGYLESKNYNVAICDAQLDQFTEKDLEKFLLKERPDLIGIPAFTNSIAQCFKTAEICKRALPKAMVVFGGVHATIMPKQVLDDCPSVDIAALGEGEYIMEDIARYVQFGSPILADIKGIAFRDNNGQAVINERWPFIDNFDDLPLPAYHLLDMSRYNPHISQYKLLPNFPIIVQRGCPFNCVFCSAHLVHGRKVRFKSVARTIEELKLLKEKYKARGVYFQDSTFTINKDFVRQLCEKMIDEKLNLAWACNTRVDCVDEELLKLMKKSGCWLVVYGVESGNQKSLDLLHKNITLSQIEKTIKLTHKLGLNSLTSYILCLPGETLADCINTINFARKLASPMSLFYLPIPYPGTELERICQEEGGIRSDAKWSDYSSVDYSNPIYINSKIGREGMQKIINLAYRRYYTTPKVLLNNLLSIDCFSDVKRYVRSVRALIGI